MVVQYCYDGDISFLWENFELWSCVKLKPLIDCSRICCHWLLWIRTNAITGIMVLWVVLLLLDCSVSSLVNGCRHCHITLLAQLKSYGQVNNLTVNVWQTIQNHTTELITSTVNACLIGISLWRSHHVWPGSLKISQWKTLWTSGPRAGSGVVRIDPLCFLAGCRTRWLNQV